MDGNAFIAELVRKWREHDCSDIDGADFQDLLLKHGLCTERAATEEDCEEEWAQEWDYEPGDNIIVYSGPLKALLESKP